MPKRTRRLRKPKRTRKLRKLPKQRGGEDLWTAASEGNPTNVQTALDEGADVNLLRSGRTPLSIACWNAIKPQISVQAYKRYLDTIKLLLDRGADPDIPNTDKTTILHDMLNLYSDLVPLRAIEVMKLLLEHGANPNLKNKFGKTPLIFAISGDYPIEKTTLLMEYGADPNIKSNLGQDAFAVAKEISNITKRTQVLNILNTVKAKTNIYMNGDPNKLDAKGFAPLHQLSFSSEAEETLIEKAKVLLEKGANLELVGGENAETPLILAIANQKPKLAAFFMDAGANPNAQNKIGSTLLQYASQLGMLEFVQRFQALGQDIRYANAMGQTALHFACDEGHPHIVQYLIEQGADINAETSKGYTPLNWCTDDNKKETLQNRLACAELLLKNGANPEKGSSPLLEASARLINHDFIPLFLKYGANPSAVGLNGFSVLESVIVKKGSLEIVKTLVEAGANVNHINTHNYTALVTALVYDRDADIARYLLEHGADPNIGKITVTVSNQTTPRPLVFHLFPDLLDLLPLFLEKGQDPNVLGQISATASTRPLHLAIITYNKNSNQTLRKNLLESIKLLVASGADLKLKDSNGYTPEELVQDEDTEKALGIIKMWEGFTRSDVAFLNSIFTKETRGNIPKANDYSLCPVCLKTVERPEGCMHMHHNCKEQPGFYHKALYEKYKSQDKIHWCTICNRIGFGLGTYFEHYVLGIAKGPVPEKAGPSQLFDNDCSLRSGGGGIPEKYQRFNTLRNVALYYNHPSFIGQKSQREVMEKLVEAMWNAPLVENPLAELKLAEGSWNRENNNFLAPKPTKSNNANNSNVPIPNSVQDPIIHPVENEEWQNATFVSDANIIQFQHPGFAHDKPGQQISRDGFAGWLNALLGNPAAEAFGHCWQYIPEIDRESASAAELANHCGSLLWPREVRVALGLAESPTEGENAEYRKLYNGYRKQFNRKQRGTTQ